MRYCSLFVVTATILVGCSNGDLQNGGTLDGSWKITKVTCNGEESTLLTSAKLADSSQVTSQATISGSNASRVWNYGSACAVTTGMTPFTYGPNSTVTAKEGAAKCGSGCAGSEPFCTNASEGQTITYGWSLTDGSTFVLSLPQAVTNGMSDPCGPGQGTDKVEFTYKRL